MTRLTIRSAYAQLPPSKQDDEDEENRNRRKRAPTTADLATDAMIERAKQMAPKPFKRDMPQPDPVPRAAADDTRVARKPRPRAATLNRITEREEYMPKMRRIRETMRTRRK